MDDSLRTDFSEKELQLILAVQTRRCYPYVFAVVVADRAIQMVGPVDRLVESLEPARDQFTPVTTEQLEARMAIQRPRQDDRQNVNAGLGVPTKRRAREQ